jgi:hypothetical protein
MSLQNGRDSGVVADTLDRLLAHRSPEFRARLLEVVARNGWNVNDPSFVILLATGQMELLLQQLPDDLESLMNEALEQFDERLRLLERASNKARSSIDATIQRSQTIAETNSLMTDTITTFFEQSSAERFKHILEEWSLRSGKRFEVRQENLVTLFETKADHFIQLLRNQLQTSAPTANLDEARLIRACEAAISRAMAQQQADTQTQIANAISDAVDAAITTQQRQQEKLLGKVFVPIFALCCLGLALWVIISSR